MDAAVCQNFALRPALDYPARVLGKLGRRALDVIVLVFAALGFVYVPLGQRTGLEHVRAIFSTPEAERAGRELEEAVIGLGDELRERRGAGAPRKPPKPRATDLSRTSLSTEPLMCQAPEADRAPGTSPTQRQQPWR